MKATVGSDKVATAHTAAYSLSLAPYLDHWFALQPLLYGYCTASSQANIPLTQFLGIFVLFSLDSSLWGSSQVANPSLFPPCSQGVNYLAIYSFGLDL